MEWICICGARMVTRDNVILMDNLINWKWSNIVEFTYWFQWNWTQNLQKDRWTIVKTIPYWVIVVGHSNL